MVVKENPHRKTKMLWVAYLRGSNAERASCSTVLFISKVPKSQEELLLGNPRAFNAFHRSLGLLTEKTNSKIIRKTSIIFFPLLHIDSRIIVSKMLNFQDFF